LARCVSGHPRKTACYDQWRRMAKASPRLQYRSSAIPVRSVNGLAYSGSAWPASGQGRKRRGNDTKSQLALGSQRRSFRCPVCFDGAVCSCCARRLEVDEMRRRRNEPAPIQWIMDTGRRRPSPAPSGRRTYDTRDSRAPETNSSRCLPAGKEAGHCGETACAEGRGEMTGPRPAGRPWTLTDDDMFRKLLVSGMKPQLIAQKMKRSIGAIQSRISRLKRKRSEPKA
jgi:hypothetical protein